MNNERRTTDDGKRMMNRITDKTTEKTAHIPHLFEIVSDVKEKKELSNLDSEFVKKKIEVFFFDIHNHQYKLKVMQKLENSKSYKQFRKSKEHDFLIKGVRTELRKVYGAFILEDYDRKYKILDTLKKQFEKDHGDEGIDESVIFDTHVKLLELHKSTKERMNHYVILYDKIFNEFLKDRYDRLVIMDLACGLNPLSNIFFRDKIKKYYASDISSEDCAFLKEYFSTTKIDSEVFPMDLTEEKDFSKLSAIKCDICFIFKTLDGLERVKRNITENLLKSIDARYFVITFPTLSLGGVREIKEHRRLWFEKLLNRLEWRWEKTLVENELLYLIEKK